MGFVLKRGQKQQPAAAVMANPAIVGYTVRWVSNGRCRQRQVRGTFSQAQSFAKRLRFGSNAVIVPRVKK